MRAEIDEDNRLVELCGNPVFPGYMIYNAVTGVFWIFDFFMPVLHVAGKIESGTFADVMFLRYSRSEGILGFFLSLVVVPSWIMFSLLQEDGRPLTTVMNGLRSLASQASIFVGCSVSSLRYFGAASTL